MHNVTLGEVGHSHGEDRAHESAKAGGTVQLDLRLEIRICQQTCYMGQRALHSQDAFVCQCYCRAYRFGARRLRSSRAAAEDIREKGDDTHRMIN